MHPSLTAVRLPGSAARVLSIFALVLLLAVLVAPSARAGTWTVGEIVGPPGTTNVIPRAVNINGVVVGTARFPGATQDMAFRWEDGVMIELANPGVEQTVALDINDAGVIVGYGKHAKGTCSTNPFQGVVWTATTSTSSASLTSFSGYKGSVDYGSQHCTHGSWINGINNSGQMVGRAGANLGEGAFGPRIVDKPSTTTGGGWTALSLPDVITESSAQIFGGEAYAINDEGGIVGFGGPGGSRARVWNSPGPYPIELIAGPHGINRFGHIAGRTMSSSYGGRMWNGSGYVSLPSGLSYTEAYAINDAGWVVGRTGTNFTSQLQPATAMLWEVEGDDVGASRLFTLAPSGWSMYSALDINQDGMIVGTGKRGDDPVGYWMAPASIAHQLSGTVRDAAGQPAAGVNVVVRNAAGIAVATFTTGADGSYSGSVNRGSYSVRVEATASFRPDGLAGCTIVGDACELGLSQNRVVDFFGTDIVVPGGGGAGGGSAAPAPAPGGAAGPSLLSADPPQLPGPTISWPKGGKSATVNSKGKVGVNVGPVAAGVTGTLVIETKSTYKVKASSKRADAASRSKQQPTSSKARIALGSTAFSFKKASKNGQVSFKLSKSGAKFLKSKGSLQVVLRLTLVGTDGGTSTAERTIKLSAPRRR